MKSKKASLLRVPFFLTTILLLALVFCATSQVWAEAPALNWTGNAGFESDGVNPDSAVSGSSFEFQVEYTDADNDAPTIMQVWVDLDNSGDYEETEKFDMTSMGGSDYTSGVDYSCSRDIDYTGDGTINYRFYFSDGTADATGDPTTDHTFTVTVTNNAPTLSWTGNTGFESDGVNPDSAVSGSSFEFQVEYTDADNDAPTIMQVWVDLNDTGDYEETEKFDMTTLGGSDYTSGVDYSYSTNIDYAGDGTLNYTFHFNDGTADATGDPTKDHTFTVTQPKWSGTCYVSKSGSNTPPYDTWDTAATSIQTAIDYASDNLELGEVAKVIVAAGTYAEAITMKDRVDVEGAPGETPKISFASSAEFTAVVTFSGSITCTLRGFDITNSGLGGGILLNGSEAGITASIESCDVHDSNFGGGIRLNGVVSPSITGCNIYGNFEVGIGVSEIRRDELESGSSVTIRGNTIGGNGQGNRRAGIRLRGSKSNNIQVAIGGSAAGDSNTISYNARSGIRLEDIDQVSIENNNISNNSDAGIVLIDTSSVSPHIKNNDIHNHGGEAGINIGGASNLAIGDNNDIYSNYAGIVFYVSTNSKVDGDASSQSVTITGNNIYGNSYAGIAVRDPITGVVTITQNDIYQNSRGGIGIQNSCDLLITKNDIYDNVRGGIHTGTDVADGGGFSGSMGSAILTIRQNKVHNNGMSNYGGGIDVRHASGTIQNNLVYDNRRGGIRFGWQDEFDPHVTSIRNNTVVSNGNATENLGGGIIYDSLSGAVNDSPEGIPPGKLFIRNNICAYNQRAGLRACFTNTQGSEERDYNLLYSNCGWNGTPDCGWPNLNMQCANQQYGGCGAHWEYDPRRVVLDYPNDIMANPLFRNMSVDDYELQTGSPAELAGDDGKDMGAYGGTYPID
ncbi:MAG: hypothetical protein BA865_02445 [Desulfobacterales bacterium S5133MH4]|nr:MAG: hypothetical protein BA865_02445 [Desulfobacterales bacterium S5133MH4]